MRFSTALRGFLCLSLLLTARALPAQDWAEKMFEKTHVDFGVVAKGAEVKIRLTVTNKYKETVHIAGVTTKCRCISAKMLKDTLHSLETAELEIKLDTVGFDGVKDTHAKIEIDAPFPAVVTIPVHADIRKEVVLTPGSVDFGSVGKGVSLERRIQVAYAGRNDWKIKNVQNSCEHLDASIVEKSRNFGRVTYELVVRTKPSAPLGDLRTQLTLVTDDAVVSRIPVLVEGKVDPEYTVSPDIVQFGALQPGEKKTLNIVVRANNRKAFGIEKVESERTAGAFEVRLPEDQRIVHVLPLTLTAPTDAGTINEEFTLTIRGMPDPLRFRVYGKVLTDRGAARLINR